eukprot:13827596-Alexandrium_andersonii.AAC.1
MERAAGASPAPARGEALLDVSREDRRKESAGQRKEGRRQGQGQRRRRWQGRGEGPAAGRSEAWR